MLVHEHAGGDSAHVEAVQEVLNVLVGDRVHSEGLLILHHALSHGVHHVVVTVTNVYQSLCEAEGRDTVDVSVREGGTTQQDIRLDEMC